MLVRDLPLLFQSPQKMPGIQLVSVHQTHLAELFLSQVSVQISMILPAKYLLEKLCCGYVLARTPMSQEVMG